MPYQNKKNKKIIKKMSFNVFLDREKKTVYVKQSLIHFLYLKPTIEMIMSACGFPYPGCGFYKNCEGYFVLHMSDIEGITDKNFHRYSDNINGAFYVIIFPEVIEIYSVCVPPKFRGKRVIQEMLESLISLAGDKNLWLGIALDNDSWDKVLHLYTKYGFINPYLTDKTSQNASIGVTVMGFYRRKDATEFEVEIAREEANYLRKVYLGEIIQPDEPEFFKVSKILISKNLNMILKDLLNKDREYGGIFRFMSKDRKGDYLLGLSEKDFIEGSGEPTFQVQWSYIDGYIMFHTHPSICYERHRCFLGWPSAADMVVVMHLFLSHFVILNLVYTVEGIYFISLRTWFQDFLNRYRENAQEECINQLENAVRDYFSNSTEVGEPARAINNKQENTLETYFALVNSLTLNNLLDKYKNLLCLVEIQNEFSNETLFDVKLITWQEIESRQYLAYTLKYISENEPPLEDYYDLQSVLV